MISHDPSGVIVVGGGWAGLTAAVELSRNKIPVTMFESAKQLGGRARCVRFGESRVDNGQHIMIGAYNAMFQLLETLQLDEEQILLRLPLLLKLLSPEQPTVSIRGTRLPGSLSLLGALLTARGLRLHDKLTTLLFMARLNARHFTLEHDESVSHWLQHCGQPPQVIHALWEPLCIATLNTPPHEASAILFARVLREAFGGSRRNADLLLPRSDLGTTIPEPAADYIEKHGGLVHLSRRIGEVMFGKEEVIGVAVEDEVIEARDIILATPHHVTAHLLAPCPVLRETAERLESMPTEPICTVYLRYPETVCLELPLTGMLDTLGQWVVDRRVCGQPGLLSVVISADGPHMAMENGPLAARVAGELRRLFPQLPAPLESLVIREKRATIASRVGIDALRPANRTALDGLWLAGDYTDTGLPATLEGAIRSGLQCATGIVARRRATND